VRMTMSGPRSCARTQAPTASAGPLLPCCKPVRFRHRKKKSRLQHPSASHPYRLPAARPSRAAPHHAPDPPHAPVAALRRSLSHVREGRVDVPALVRRISRAETVRRLPRAARRSAGGEVWIVFDVAHRLIPYEQDFASIISEVRRLQVWPTCTCGLFRMHRMPCCPSSTAGVRWRPLAGASPPHRRGRQC
jgi:hypothetical protein